MIIDTKCAQCVADEKAIRSWRIAGGEMPHRECTKDHRPKCASCGEKHEGRASGMCDDCYATKRRDGTRVRSKPLSIGEIQRELRKAQL